MDESLLRQLVSAFIGRDGPADNGVVIEGDELVSEDQALRRQLSDVSGGQVDDGLREAVHRGWVRGERGEGSGPLVWWSELVVTVAGLRHLGEWPPPGQEYLAGGWDLRMWGTSDRGILRELSESPPPGGYVGRPSGGEEDKWPYWRACLRLREAGLLDGDDGDGYLGSVRLTTAGQNALYPPADDPLVRARLKLSHGSKVDAVTAAIDEALKPRMLILAEAAGLAREALPHKLSVLNDQLRQLGAYGASDLVSEAVRAQVSAWLKLRNVVAHGKGEAVDDVWVALMLDGIERFLIEWPGAPNSS